MSMNTFTMRGMNDQDEPPHMHMHMHTWGRRELESHERFIVHHPCLQIITERGTREREGKGGEKGEEGEEGEEW